MVIRTIRGVEELEDVRGFWEEWQNHPNTDFAHFQLVCRLREEVECPHVTVLELDGKPCALLVARLERTHFMPSIGYLKLMRIPSKMLRVLYEGFLGHVSKQTAEAMVRHLLASLVSWEVDAVEFRQLPENSPLHWALLKHEPRLVLEKGNGYSTHWEMALTEEPGFLLKKLQSKHRSWIRGRQKKLDSAFPGKVHWRWIRGFDNISEFCSRVEEVAAHTYQRALGAGFVDDEEHRQRYSLFASRNQLRVQVLEIEGKVRAFWIGQVYRNVFYSEATGYDSELSGYEPGTLVLMHMIDELVQEGVRKFDFGLGDALYKKRFGDRSWRETTLIVFAPTAKGQVLRASLRACAMLDSAGRRLLQRMGFLDQLKTIWRRSLASARTDT